MEVSIIIAVHNAERYIGRAIRSALDQKFDKNSFEVIVVNDGSTDNTSKILDYYSNRIKIINLKKNKGLPYARNEGIRSSKGRFIVCLDADDYIHTDLIYIESMFLYLNPHWDAVSCDYTVVNEYEEHIKRVDGGKKSIACGVMFRVERLIDIGLYSPEFEANEEKDLLIRFKKKKNVVQNIELPLYRYRQHSSNMSKKKDVIKKYDKMLKQKHNL
jgi:glycosyltransferase involved in cell wall biosynthesis